MNNATLNNLERELGIGNVTLPPAENMPALPVMEGSQEAINRRNAIQIGSFDKVYKEFIELHKKLKENSAKPSTRLSQLQSDYYALQKKKNEIMSSYNRINRDKVTVRGRSTMNSKKADIVSKLAEIRGNIEKRQRAIQLNENTNALNNGSLASLYPNMNSLEEEGKRTPPSASAAAPAPVPAPPPAPLVSMTQMPSNNAIKARTEEFRRKAEQYRALINRLKTNNTRKNKNKTALNNGSLASLYPNMNSFEAEEQHAPPSASAAAPAPVPAPPPPPGAPPRQWSPAGPIRLPGRNTRKNAPLLKRQLKVVPPPVPPVSSKLQNNLTNRQHAKPNNNSVSSNALKTLSNIEMRLGVPNQTPFVSLNSEQSNENLFKNMHNTANRVEKAVVPKPATSQQPVQYIKLADGTIYKFIEIINDKVKARKLDRSTKTWGPIEQLTKEQVNSSRVVDCPSSPQAGGRRTRRQKITRRKTKRRTHRKSGK